MATPDWAAVSKRSDSLILSGAPYELRNAVVNGTTQRVYARAARSLNDIYRRALTMGEAVLAADGETTLSYREAFRRAARLRAAFRDRLGVRAGSRVGIALGNSLEYIVSFLAVTSLGATAVQFGVKDIQTISRDAGILDCTLLICERIFASALRNSSIPLVVAELAGSPDIGQQADMYSMARLIAESEDSEASAEGLPSLTGEAEVMISFTSGTTGPPKCVVITQLGIVTGLTNMLLSNALAAVTRGQTLHRADRSGGPPCALLVSPLAHVSGYSQLLLTLMLGGKLILTPSWNVQTVSRVIDRQKVRSLAGASIAQLSELLECRADAGPLRSIGINGTALYPGLRGDLSRKWPTVVPATGYGLTETNGSISTIAGLALWSEPQCVGKVVPSVEVKVTTADGRPLPAGKTGEVWLHGANLMSGYWQHSAPPSGLVGGWFRTGDVGSLSMDGVLSVSGRIDDIFFVDGKEISAPDLERVLMEELWISEAATLPTLSNDSAGALTVALVVKPGRSGDLGAIRRQVSARTQVPESLVTVVPCKALPRNSSGKLDRSSLRAQFIRGA